MQGDVGVRRAKILVSLFARTTEWVDGMDPLPQITQRWSVGLTLTAKQSMTFSHNLHFRIGQPCMLITIHARPQGVISRRISFLRHDQIYNYSEAWPAWCIPFPWNAQNMTIVNHSLFVQILLQFQMHYYQNWIWWAFQEHFLIQYLLCSSTNQPSSPPALANNQAPWIPLHDPWRVHWYKSFWHLVSLRVGICYDC